MVLSSSFLTLDEGGLCSFVSSSSWRVEATSGDSPEVEIEDCRLIEVLLGSSV